MSVLQHCASNSKHSSSHVLSHGTPCPTIPALFLPQVLQALCRKAQVLAGNPNQLLSDKEKRNAQRLVRPVPLTGWPLQVRAIACGCQHHT